MKPSGLSKKFTRVLFLPMAIGLWPLAAQSDVDILAPSDGYIAQADPCPVAPCRVIFGDDNGIHPAFAVRVTGAPMDFVFLDFVRADGNVFNLQVCRPPDSIEGIPGCDTPPVTLVRPTVVSTGNYTVTPRVVRGTAEEIGAPITIQVLEFNGGNVGPVALDRIEPNSGAPGLTARGDFPGSITTPADRVQIHGDNLQNNPFLQVFVAPIPFGEPDLAAGSALPAGDWCLYEAEITNRGSTTDSFLEVRLPEIATLGPTTCGVPEGGNSSIFQKNWRFVIRDPWIRPEREHQLWAIPSPRDVPWRDSPPFRMTRPAYPLIDGFGFDNHSTDARYYEFLTVYGNNAYYCVGALGLCATRLPKPLYHTLWWGIYKLVIDSSGGSCNGLSATSLLMSQEKLQPEDFEVDVHFPIGFDTPGPDSIPALDSDNNPYMQGVARYSDSNFCTPLCSPPRPDNLWAEVRKNHGVQFSKQFLGEMFETLGEAVVDIGDITNLGDEELFQGIPNATMEKIRANPRGNVLCFTSTAGGHCVTPYAVDGNRILIYDNNEPGNDTRFIEISGGDYDYPARSSDPNHGNFIIAYPIEIWEEGRSLFGLGDFLEIEAGGQALQFLAMIVAGSADMTLVNDADQRFGWEQDGSFSRSMPGAMTLPAFGPNDEPNHNGMFFLSTDRADSSIEVNANGGAYAFHTGAGDQLFQLEANHAQAGDTDRFEIVVGADRVEGFGFRPERNADAFVARGGLDFGNEEGAAFSWLGLEIPAGEGADFWASREDKSASYANLGSSATQHMLLVDHASGPADSYGRSLFGPFEVPAGAAHTLRLVAWPNADVAVSELDLDGDGEADVSERVRGHPATPTTNPEFSTDIAVSKQVDRATAKMGELVYYTVQVSNQGMSSAPSVALVDGFPTPLPIHGLFTDLGNCSSEPGRLRCDLGTLLPGEIATVSYAATVQQPGALANGAFAYSGLDDPDWTNNSAATTTDIPAPLDIKPGNRKNRVNVRSRGVLPVAILGSASFDVRAIDRRSLRFGPGESRPRHRRHGHLRDVNHDGYRDLLVHFPTRAAKLSHGDPQACVDGRLKNGRAFSGCDSIVVIARRSKHGGHGVKSDQSPVKQGKAPRKGNRFHGKHH